MIDTKEFNQRVAELEQMLHDKLGLRAKGLARQLKKAGRHLPRRVQKAGRVITQAQSVMANPKLARIQNQKSIEAAFAEMTAYLKPLKRKGQRSGSALGIAGDAVVRLILLGLVVLAALRWQGMI
jgi:hypothetical protein